MEEAAQPVAGSLRWCRHYRNAASGLAGGDADQAVAKAVQSKVAAEVAAVLHRARRLLDIGV